MSEPETQLTLQDKIREIMREWEGFFPFPDPEDSGLEAQIAFGTADKIEALFTQALTAVTELACDKCRVRMEDKLNNGGTQHENG